MSSWLDLPIAAAIWLAGFAWIGRSGTWMPLALAAIAAAARLVLGDPLTRRLLTPSRRDVVLGVAGGIAMAGVTYAVYPPLTRALPGLAPRAAGLYQMLAAGQYRLPALASLILVVSACEEIVWRGRLLSRAPGAAIQPGWPRGGQMAQALGHATLYSAAHATSGSLLLVAVALVCGFAWGLLRLASRSLWPPILTHALWDLSVLVLWPLA